MKKFLGCTAIAAAMVLTGCTVPGPDMEQPDGAAAVTETPAPKPQVPLRAYTSEQIVQVLEGLRDAKNAKPAQVLGNETILAQSQINSGLQSALTPEVAPEGCAPFVNFAPTMEDGLTMGMAVFSSGGTQVMVTVAVDAKAGHGQRAELNDTMLEQCGDVTMKLAGQEIKLSMKAVPLAIDAENSLAVRANGSAAGKELNMVNFNANTGSVMVTGAAFSSAGFDESAALSDLARMTQDALDHFAGLPDVPAAGATAPAAPTAR